MFRSFSVLVSVFFSVTSGLYGASAAVAPSPWFLQASSELRPLPISFALATDADSSVKTSADTRTLPRSAASTDITALANGGAGGEASSTGEDNDFSLWDATGAGATAEELGSADSVPATAAWDNSIAGSIVPVLGVPAGMSPDTIAPGPVAAAEDGPVGSASLQKKELGKVWNALMRHVADVGTKGEGRSATPAPMGSAPGPDSGFLVAQEARPRGGSIVGLVSMGGPVSFERTENFVEAGKVPLPTGAKLHNGLEWHEYFKALYAKQILTPQRRADMRFLLIIEKSIPEGESIRKAFMEGLCFFAMDVPNVLLGYKAGHTVVEVPIDIASEYQKLWGAGAS